VPFAAADSAKLVHRTPVGNALFMVGCVQSMLKKGYASQLQGKMGANGRHLTAIAPAVGQKPLQQLIQVQFDS